ncbi:MAG: lipopolysaccharide transport periplasmic protein LptA [Rhodobiaceae bacterium]|nr:lipopolysaccharide transport periplasmic protein LptA [Rhodobiaceae bacterium]
MIGRLGKLMMVAGIALLFLPFGAQAEDNESPVGFKTDPDAPIEIEADTLEVEQNAQTATFIGNVVAVQGAIRLRADRLIVTYAQKADSAPSSEDGADDGTGGTEITRIDAKSNVHVMSEDDQSASGDWALYMVADENITMGDTVVLRQGENVIRGQRLNIDLNSGQARVEGGVTATDTENPSSGRVRGLFQAPQQ